MFAVTGAVDGDLLTGFGEGAIPRTKDGFGKSHFDDDDDNV